METVLHAVDKQNGRRIPGHPQPTRDRGTLRMPAMAFGALPLQRHLEADDRALAVDEWQDLDLVFANRTGGIRVGFTGTRNLEARPEHYDLAVIRSQVLRHVFAALLHDCRVPPGRFRGTMGHSGPRPAGGDTCAVPDPLDGDMAPSTTVDGGVCLPNPSRSGVQMGVRGGGRVAIDPDNKHPRLDSNQRPAD